MAVGDLGSPALAKLGPRAAAGRGELGMGKQGSHTSLGFLTQMTKGLGLGGPDMAGSQRCDGKARKAPPHCMGLSSSLKAHAMPRGKVGGPGGQWKLELALQGASSGIH